MSYLPIIGAGGSGGGLLYPDSADRPFNSNSARNNWANNNKADLIKDTTVVNVNGTQWFLWTGESNPATVQTSLWMDASEIIQGETGVSITGATIDANGDLIVSKNDGTSNNAGRAVGFSAYEVWINEGNTGTVDQYLLSLKGEDGDLVYQQLDIADYGNFFAADWGNLGTNIYGVTGLGNQFTNVPFPLNASNTYSFECLLVNEANQYSLRVTSMANADFENAGRDAILSGLTKTAAESVGWKVYAFTSDPGHSDPTEGFELQTGANKIGLNNDGALTVRDSQGAEHNAVDNGVDIIRVGSPSLDLELRTNQERITVQNSQGDTELAYVTDIPSPTNPQAPARFAYFVREGEYTVTEGQIQEEVLLEVQPLVDVGDEKVTTIFLPNQATFTAHYHIPGINDADAGVKPHISSFRFTVRPHYFQTEPVKIILRSDGDWLPFVSSDSLAEYQGVYLYRETQQDSLDEHDFAFMRPLNFNPAVGLDGWSFHNPQPHSWIPLNAQPPTSPPVSTLGTLLVDDNEAGHIRTDSSINSTHDLATGETTLSVVPLSVDGNPAETLVMGAGIAADHDPATNEVTLTVDPTNIDLSGYAELEKEASFSKVTIKNPTDPLFESVVNVTNGGNTDARFVGTTNIRKVDKTTGVATDVMNINGTSGALDLRTDATYQGAINADESLVNRQYVDGMTYYKGQGLGIPAPITISTNTVNQNAPVAYFENSLSHDSETIIVIDESLVASETIIKVSPLAQYSSKTFLLYHGATDNGEKTIRRGETWRIRLDASGSNHWVYERVDDGTRVTRGLGDRLTPVEHPYVGVFQYTENMPYHLLVETQTSSRLVHEFPREKTFRFTPISTGREHDNNVVVNEANQGVATGDLALGQYSDLPLYVIEPNVVVNRDQRAWINFPANMTLDVSSGFYAFGTVSGWCGNNTSEGNVGVYVGTSENFRSYTQNIGFVLGNSGVFLLDGQNLRTAQNSAAIQYNIEPGVTHMIRYAFYVDDAGIMTYYIVDLNTGQLSTGTQQCNLASLGSNPKLYISYDRYGNNTAAIAIAETHLVVNSVGGAEGRWNWRN